MSVKKIGMKIFNWAIVVAAYGYLIYTFATFEDYPTLLAHFRTCGTIQWGCLALCIALVPLNFFCEAWKWRYLLRKIEPMDMIEAQKQTYFGFVGAFLTPERLGDYPTRVTRIEDKNKWLPAITMGFAGTMALSMVNIACGMLSFAFSQVQFEGISKQTIVHLAIGLVAIFIALLFLLPWIARIIDGKRTYKPAIQALIDMVKNFQASEFPAMVGMSFCRYMVYAFQLLLVLIFCGVNLEWHQYLTIIPIHYLFVSIVPTVPVADGAVRGSIGMMIFGYYGCQSISIAITFIMLWLINTMIPMIIGTMMKTQTQT